jgi:hypothetical protein
MKRGDRAYWIFVLAFVGVWFILNLIFLKGLIPIDFYGDGAWFAQEAIRWAEMGWPTHPIAGYNDVRGLGPFSLWLNYASLLLFFKAFGVSVFAARLRALVSITVSALFFAWFIKSIRKDRSLVPAIFLVVLLLSPWSTALAHAERPEATVACWVTGTVAVGFLAKREWLKAIAFFLLPFCFWGHQLSVTIPFFLMLVMAVYAFRDRKYLRRAPWILAGLVFVAGVSLLAAHAAGKLTLAEVFLENRPNYEPGRLLGELHIFVPMILLLLFPLAWCIGRAETDIEPRALRIIALGVILLPLVFGVRARRIYNFSFPFLLSLLYIVYLYLKKWEKLAISYMFTFLLGTALFIVFYWKTHRYIEYTLENPVLERKITSFLASVDALRETQDTVVLDLWALGAQVWWYLPYDKQLTARQPIPGGNEPMRPGRIYFFREPQKPERMGGTRFKVDSLVVEPPYILHHEFNISRIYVYVPEEGH